MKQLLKLKKSVIKENRCFLIAARNSNMNKEKGKELECEILAIMKKNNMWGK